jgi:hypothetical protein
LTVIEPHTVRNMYVCEHGAGGVSGMIFFNMVLNESKKELSDVGIAFSNPYWGWAKLACASLGPNEFYNGNYSLWENMISYPTQRTILFPDEK